MDFVAKLDAVAPQKCDRGRPLPVRSIGSAKIAEFQMWAWNQIRRGSMNEKRADKKKYCRSYDFSQRAEFVPNRDQKFTNHGQAKRNARDHLGKYTQNMRNINYDFNYLLTGDFCFIKQNQRLNPEKTDTTPFTSSKACVFSVSSIQFGSPSKELQDMQQVTSTYPARKGQAA
ncbi:hypothetical protein BMW22_02440 [Rhizobium leguminosarum]|uniref:Uncharacterized protein n=1 Tax=Rhizobium leguminosarum TaxID=384 RepID=A0A1L3Z4P7_RHILE|nr:hypothetical protein [Rhizobium leguminosarum]API50643.1 hypothetical protein BMW22_02440 [Rhizobium leguminosarum]